MNCLHYQEKQLYIENVRLNDIANTYGTPCYVYSRAAITTAWHEFDSAFRDVPHRLCYAVKANSNLAILQLLAQLGAGFDIVSGGELERVLAAGGNPAHIVFSGVGKSSAEIRRAIQAGIFCFNVESEAELNRISLLAAEQSKRVNISLRINPDVDPNTHSHIVTGHRDNKFGIDMNDVIPLCKKMKDMPSLQLVCLAGHIGSQILDLDPFLLAIDRLISLYHELVSLGMPLHYLNIGGGLGITYKDETPPAASVYAAAVKQKCEGLPIELIMEPGRYLVGNAGVLLTRIEYIKTSHGKHFAIVDAGLNDLMRPALYHAWQNILPVQQRQLKPLRYDVVGPVCESADFLGKDRELAIQQDDLLVVASAGAYGFSMSSNYNSRCRAAEVLVDEADAHLIRRREPIHDLFAAENKLTYMAKPG